jgi:adenylate cyclase
VHNEAPTSPTSPGSPATVGTVARTRFPSDEYGFEITSLKGVARALVSDVEIAASRSALILTETRLEPVCYFPPADVRTDLLEPSPTRTHCPFRGNAQYWNLLIDGVRVQDAAWSYPQPFHDARRLKGHVAFHTNVLDDLVVDSMPALAPDPAYPNPLVGWVLHRAPSAGSIIELIEQFTSACLDAAIPLWRVWLSVQTLHPLLYSTSYTWQLPQPDDARAELTAGNDGGIVERTVHHGVFNDEQFLESPLRPILEGAGGVRCRLEGDNPDLDYPIVRDHWKAGATDYVAMPVVFSDSQINVLTLTTTAPGGFSTRDLSFVYEVLPVFARMLEVHATHRKSVSLLRTYLGRTSGERVLSGQIKRGDRERTNCVIWFCDLRDSSAIAERESSDDYLDTLNQFYDCLAQPVLDEGGEVLRFIGDAALAIFPIDALAHDPKSATADACQRALNAADCARANLERANLQRGDAMPLGFGIGLHVGEVTYGNIGTADRLEFTVIGPATNMAARLQDLCKTLNRSVLVSQSFVDGCPEHIANSGFERIGKHHPLRGFRDAVAVYALT